MMDSCKKHVFDCWCLSSSAQGPQGRSGLAGLPGADGPPVSKVINIQHILYMQHFRI